MLEQNAVEGTRLLQGHAGLMLNGLAVRPVHACDSAMGSCVGHTRYGGAGGSPYLGQVAAAGGPCMAGYDTRVPSLRVSYLWLWGTVLKLELAVIQDAGGLHGCTLRCYETCSTANWAYNGRGLIRIALEIRIWTFW